MRHPPPYLGIPKRYVVTSSRSLTLHKQGGMSGPPSFRLIRDLSLSRGAPAAPSARDGPSSQDPSTTAAPGSNAATFRKWNMRSRTPRETPTAGMESSNRATTSHDTATGPVRWTPAIHEQSLDSPASLKTIQLESAGCLRNGEYQRMMLSQILTQMDETGGPAHRLLSSPSTPGFSSDLSFPHSNISI